MQLESRCARMSKCYIPLLESLVSGYVIKIVTIFLMVRQDVRRDNDWFLKADDLDDLEDAEEAAYSEAMKVIFKKHSGTDAEATILKMVIIFIDV